GWGGPEPADPLEAFRALVDRFGLRRARVGLETPPYYLHPHHHARLKELLGAALVAEPSNLIHELKQVKSSREIALIRESARMAHPRYAGSSPVIPGMWNSARRTSATPRPSGASSILGLRHSACATSTPWRAPPSMRASRRSVTASPPSCRTRPPSA